MSDRKPPPAKPPKPGSLRKRIAEFENKGAAATTALPPAPPAVRPKPGNVQWKPRPPSPPTPSDAAPSVERKPASTGGMSVSDAMESIGRSGSLKERMAALQGKGGFGVAGAPPPIALKPLNAARPKWRPPPAVPAPVSSQDEGIAKVDVGGREASRSPSPRAALSPTPENQGATNQEGNTIEHKVGGDADTEGEEKQRRAAIVARMARLGGTRSCIGPPPIIAPKPVMCKSEPAPAAPEAKEGGHANQPALAKASNKALVSSAPRDVPGAASHTPEAVVGTEHKDEHEASAHGLTRAPVAMPIPAGPRRAAPPRKNMPTAAVLPESPVKAGESEVTQPLPITDEPTMGVDRTIHDASLTTGYSQEIVEAAKATNDGHLNITADSEQRPAPPPVPIEAFHEPVEVEPEKQEAEEELVEGADSRVEEEFVHTTADDQQVPCDCDQPPEMTEVEEEDEEACRQRVAAKIAQMGAFNPLGEPTLVPPRQSFDEQGPSASEELLDVEDKVNVDTEEHPEVISRPLVVPASHDTAEPYIETEQDNPKVNEEDQVLPHCDGEHAAAYAEEQGDGQDGYTVLAPEFLEPMEYEPVHVVDEQEQSTASMKQAGVFEVPGTSSLGPDEQESRLQGGGDDLLARSTMTKAEHEAERGEISPQNTTRPPPLPSVILQSKSSPISPPPLLLPLQAPRADEEERSASPDVPPRTEGSSIIESPSPQGANRGPTTPPIITTLAVQEQVASEELENELVIEEPLETGTPQPEVQGDETSSRRRAITERMPRLQGIRMPKPEVQENDALMRRRAISERMPRLQDRTPQIEVQDDETSAHRRAISERIPRLLGTRTPETEVQEDEASARCRAISEHMPRLLGRRTPEPEVQEGESSHRRAISERMPRLQGIRSVTLPHTSLLSRPLEMSTPLDETESEGKEEEPREWGEEDGEAKKQHIVTKSAGMGDMRLGMFLPSVGVPPASAGQLVARQEDSGSEDAVVPPTPAPAPPQRPLHTRKLPPPIEPSTSSPLMTFHSVPPGRPPVPTIPVGLRQQSTTVRSTSSSRKTSMEEESSPGETPVMSRHTLESAMRGLAGSNPSLSPVIPSSAIDLPEALTGNMQWELLSTPEGVEFGEGSELASSGQSENSTAVHNPPPVVLSHTGSRRPSSKVITLSSMSGSSAGAGAAGSRSGSALGRWSTEQRPQLTTDELMTIWGKVGAQVVGAATTLFEKSKRALVGDGSYAGFVRAVLAQVPGAVAGDEDEDDWGYVVYAQTGNTVQRRVSDILPGDVIAFYDAKLKGYKGLQAYTQTVGAGESGPLMGIVSEFEVKKSKVRVWQANQHVGQQTSLSLSNLSHLSVFRRLSARAKNGVLTPRATQTVESISYRLEDLKSGQVKVYRVLDASVA